MIIRYVRKPDGQMDEHMTVAKRLRTKDHQTAAVILDFNRLTVVQASLAGTTVPKDFDRIVKYYHQYYASTIERLFRENGYEINPDSTATDTG
jgi:hypothetical protein